MCSWTKSLLSTPPAADFGPCPEAVEEGSAAGRGICLHTSRRRLWAWPGGGGGGVHSWTGYLLRTPFAADFGPGLEARRRGVLLDWELLPTPLAPSTSAWPGGGGGRERSWTGSCFVRLSPLTSGQARKRRRRGGLRDGPAWRERHRRSTYRLLLRITTASGLLLDCSLDICTFGFVSVNLWSQNVRSLDDSLLPRRLWRAGRGVRGRGTCAAVSIIPLAAARVEAWLEGLLLRLALAGPAGYLKKALLLSCLGCYVADCA